MIKESQMKVIVKCPKCEWRIFDKVTPTSGVIELKCPNCHKVVSVDLSLRKSIKYRLAMVSPEILERKYNRIR